MQELEPSRRVAVESLLSSSPYAVVGSIGRGGMGEVFVVEHRFLGRRFALKLIHPLYARAPAFVERLRLEARALGHLAHPNVVEVADLWFAPDGSPCLVLELLQGRTLGKELRARKRLSPDEAVRFCREALSGLGAAHAIGVVHRDIKPDNFFLHEVPEYGRVLKILDFGLARVIADSTTVGAPAPRTSRTTTGATVGSPRYMSPEALRGERLDHRTDLYCVGLILYEMLTGQGPFDVHAGPPSPPSELNRDVPASLDGVVLQALREDQQGRFQTADEFVAALRHV